MDENALERSSVQLEEGRMPENDSELLISKTIFTNGGKEITMHYLQESTGEK